MDRSNPIHLLKIIDEAALVGEYWLGTEYAIDHYSNPWRPTQFLNVSYTETTVSSF